MKILFTIYQLDFADHIAVAYLSAVAKGLGHSTFLCVLKDSDLCDAVESVKPDVVAYSANIYGFEEMVAAHKRARASHGFVSIMGGPQTTFSPETFADAGVDAYCIGEGEGAFEDFLKCVDEGRPFDDVPNLLTGEKTNAPRPLIADLDELPFPDRDLTLAGTCFRNTPKKTFYATRGCPYKCTYCCNNYLQALYRGKGPLVRRFSVDRILREIEYVKGRYRTDFIKFGDDLFAAKADDWLREFAEQYQARIGVPFNCYLRIDRVDEELLRLLKQAGCFSVHLSVDCMSRHVREAVLGRQMREADLVGNLRMIRGFGINTWVNFMLAAPESTLDDDLDSIWLSKQGDVTYTAYSTTVPMKGTQLYDYCVERHLLDPTTHRSDMVGCYRPSTLSCFSARDKRTRYNIYLLGALIAKLPFPLDRLAVQAIKVLPPNPLFRFLRSRYYQYSIENRIFALHRQPDPA